MALSAHLFPRSVFDGSQCDKLGGHLNGWRPDDRTYSARRPAVALLRLVAGITLAVAATVGCVSCSGSAEQARLAKVEAEQAELKAEQAESAANRARAAAQQAEIAADRAQKAVEDASREINRVAEHLERMGYRAAGND